MFQWITKKTGCGLDVSLYTESSESRGAGTYANRQWIYENIGLTIRGNEKGRILEEWAGAVPGGSVGGRREEEGKPGCDRDPETALVWW